MKKFYLAFALLGCMVSGVNSQTLLYEDFEVDFTAGEGEDPFTPNFENGWTTVDSYQGNKTKFRWNIYYAEKGTISGTHCASVDGAMSFDTEGFGPREELLLSPELSLNDTYQLSFDWKAASASALDNKEYDFEVRVVVDGDMDNAEKIWSFQDADLLKESGVTSFPWTGWQTYNSKLDLSKWQGKNVKVVFAYKMLKQTANVVYLDNVVVKKFTPQTTPLPQLSLRTYSFGSVYLGSKFYSDVITLSNKGASGLTISDIELPAGVSCTLDKEGVNLGKNESVTFQLAYVASLTSAAEGDVVFKTNGGDVALHVTATKQALPVDGSFEGFENGVPPAGWTNKGWYSTYYALEGERSACATVSFEGASELVSPRLDLSNGRQEVSFTYANQFDSETEGAVPENDVTLEFSKDGGATWSTVWTAPYAADKLNKIFTETVDLGTPASDNCLLKWKYGAISYDSESYPEISVFYLDCVVLPKIYGMGGVPSAATLVAPANGSADVYNKNIVLSWNNALFAEGYKLYVGTDANATDLINGQDLGTAITYTIPVCDYATTYNWKVVPYNAVGDAENVETWSFTTIADQTVSEFPYVEGFNGETFPTIGWYVDAATRTKWSNNSINPYEGKYSISVSCYDPETESSLVSPDFKLPEDPMEISFYWGNDMPVSLNVDQTGLVENTATADNGIEACFFEVFSDGKWEQLAILSDKDVADDNHYWYRQRVDLSSYAGKTVSFRWRYIGHNYFKSQGVGLDLISISSKEDVKASFNVPLWDAGKVNYNKSVSSTATLSLLNDGASSLKIKSVGFGSQNFSTDLAAGTVIEPKKGVSFHLTFNAGTTSAKVNDEMTVAFENDYSVALPVEGDALGSDTRYYNFENDKAGSIEPDGFKTIDVDRRPTLNMTGMLYPSYGTAFAFSVQETSDWNNVLEPVSGTKALVAISPDDESYPADDWIISQRMTATSESKFSFYGRNWESVNSIYPNAQSSVEVLVSTKGCDDTADFETVMNTTTMPYYDNVSYTYYEVDLGKYAGQEIYVALRHTVNKGLAAFFDDFMFSKFSAFSGVGALKADAADVAVYPNPTAGMLFVRGVESADITVTSVSGAVVLRASGVSSVDVSGLSAGMYLVTVVSGNDAYTTRIVKK